jgi:hypothetical protein
MKEINLPTGTMFKITMAPDTAPKPPPYVAAIPAVSFSVEFEITPDECDTFRLMAAGFNPHESARLKALKKRAGSLYHHFLI